MSSELEQFKTDVRALAESGRRLHDGIRSAEQQLARARSAIARGRASGAKTSRLEQHASTATAELRRAHAAIDGVQLHSSRYVDTV